jgi:hydrocephalus-inducing protein
LIPSLPATVKPFNISLMARGVRPLCHFDLQESNYLIAKQEGEFGNQNTSQLGHAGSGTASLIASLPKSTKVIEFNSCGIFTKNYKRFYIFNPSNYGYKFQWNSEATGTNASMFTCNTPTGFLNAGKRCEISFEYNPESGKTMVC